jgi:hypothetical protein
MDAAIATTPIPTNRTGYTGEIPIISQPTPNKAMQPASTNPQCRRSMSVTTPPGNAITPETTSRVVEIAPTWSPLKPKVATTAGNMTKKL